MLTDLARALRLAADEHDHLFHLAGLPAHPAGPSTEHVQPGMLALLDRLATTPARITTDLDETVAQNRLATALLGDPGVRTGPAASFAHRGVELRRGLRQAQLDVHVGSALDIGITTDQITGTLLHAAVRCGIPRALNATAVAKTVLPQRGLLPHDH